MIARVLGYIFWWSVLVLGVWCILYALFSKKWRG